MKHNREYNTVLTSNTRYANYVYTPPTSLNFNYTGLTGTGTGSSTSTTTTTGNSGNSGWAFFDNLGSNIFGWLGGKQTVHLANVTSNRDIATDSNKTTRTTIIVLGLVALAIVGAIVIKSSKK